ncbi:MAG: hypothetical protein J6X18_12855 [Bacteroidales bacterium]|nr:hypothetical protein [Bacteroidales bacterium]
MIDFRKSLMRGDLVYNHRNWICPVFGMDAETVTIIAQHYGEETFLLEDIHPIPLTEEIILNLGWEEIGKNHPDYKKKIGVGKQFKHPWYTSSLIIRQNALTDMYSTLNGEFVLRYLHDLQHVLLHTVEDEIQYDYEKDELLLLTGGSHKHRYQKKGIKQ